MYNIKPSSSQPLGLAARRPQSPAQPPLRTLCPLCRCCCCAVLDDADGRGRLRLGQAPNLPCRQRAARGGKQGEEGVKAQEERCSLLSALAGSCIPRPLPLPQLMRHHP